VYWFWFFAAPALVAAALSLPAERRRAAYFAHRLGARPAPLPPLTLIVPVKGADYGLRENLAALASQDYPDYEIIIVARTASDIPGGVLPSRARIVFAHGEDPLTSEKVQNLMAGVRAARMPSKVLAFADSDCRPGRGWLSALAAPLGEPGVGASTGFRWFTPAAPAFWSLLRGVWDAVASGLPGEGSCPFAWGGAMAIRKETFYELRMLERWKGAVSDDYALSAAVRAAGLSIAFAPGALTPCFEPAGMRRFFSWSRRQMLLTRFHDRRLWAAGLAAHAFYCAGMAAALAAGLQGSVAGWCALAAQTAAGMGKGWYRARLSRAALPECDDWFRRYGWAQGAFAPLATWLWLITLAGSAFGSSIEWRGYRYDLRRLRGGR
jgi:ceramide glucosyltransferase